MATSQRKGMRMPLAKPVLRCDRHLQLIVGGPMATRVYRIDPLVVLGAIPLQPFAGAIIDWYSSNA